MVSHNEKVENEEKLVGEEHGSCEDEVQGQGEIEIESEDTLKREAALVVEDLMKVSVNPIMVTGDNWRTAQVVVKEVGIIDVRAKVLPIGKAHVILSFQKGGKIVGEGEINALIEKDENRPFVNEEKNFEEELKPNDLIPDEDTTYESEEEHNKAYAILHYLHNPRVVKRMVQSTQAVLVVSSTASQSSQPSLLGPSLSPPLYYGGSLQLGMEFTQVRSLKQTHRGFPWMPGLPKNTS
ncbi:unnamed protein product [Fraxinus pennsylvanica]|uniref:Uncharacterized protein n=1 Tax=Fraxinus pennsylvanica TaxID=56036 RepID=A0AAD2AC51_9LAMI|nr:unnamed protein product [Fraxinus pennsylvanica]